MVLRSSPSFVERVEDHADVAIHLRHRVADVAGAGLAGEVRMRERGEVDERERQIEEERLSRPRAARHEIDRALGGLAIDGAARLEVERLHRSGGLAGLALPDVRRIVHRAALRLVARIADAVPLVEALVRRRTAGGVAEMPLAEHRARVAERLEELGERDLPQRHSGPRLGVAERAGAHAVASGEQCRARRRAERLDVEVGEPHALLRERVDARRRHAAVAAVDADLAVPEVVGIHDDDVRRRGAAGWRRRALRGDDRR